ncbi:uncharacterized protein LOC133330559 [Musca vetustissima]|uniref:uncharacterized protein LOC133330559 n=1 Tax=Musca vetustissima TaxID=27455 RepID=UPI002AB7CBEB|nr:uncharacterized protein LOC133330559 [Musca vetustissima]
MNKLSLVLLICCSVAILADRPDWYPENETEIEMKCQEENSISTETMNDIWAYKFDDTPEIRKLMLCLVERKNIYNKEMGFKADRLQIALTSRIKMDCKLEFVEKCGKEAKDITPADAMIFSIMKCIVAGMDENCKKVE